MRRRARRAKNRVQNLTRVSLFGIDDPERARRADALARAGLAVRSSALLASSRIHLHYTFNRQIDLAAACWDIVENHPTLLRNQQVLHMLLKSAWVIGDRELLVLAVGALSRGLPTPANAAYIGMRKGADPAFADAAQALSHRAFGALYSELITHEPHSPKVDAPVRILDLLEVYELPEALHQLLTRQITSATVQRYLGRMATRHEDWTEAWGRFRAAAELAPSRGIYDDLADTAIYLPNTDQRLAELIEERSSHSVSVTGYDRLLAMKHMMDGDLLQYLLLRGDQTSNAVASSVFGEASTKSMGRSVTPFEVTPGSLFVIGRDGVADEVRWASYYSSLEGFYADVSFSCDPRLTSLFERSFPWATFYPVARNWGRALWSIADSPRDQVPHFELAGRLDNRAYAVATVADEVMFIEDVATRSLLTEGRSAPNTRVQHHAPGYLIPQADRVEHWREAISEQMRNPEHLRVGIIWRSSLIDLDRQRHYLTLADFAPLLDLPIELVSIQHHPTVDEVAEGSRMGIHWVHDHVDLYDDFEEIAALTASLDLVVGISTLPYEMAAATGTECWLAAISPNGRWLRLGRDGTRDDLLTWGGSVFYPRTTGGYLAGRADRVASIMGQMTEALRDRLTQATGSAVQ